MDPPGQSNCYHTELAERIARAHIHSEYTIAEIAGLFEQHPCVRTVQRICDDVRAGRAAAKRGKKGIKHTNKKFNSRAARILTRIVTADEQLYLSEIKDKMERWTRKTWTISHLSKCLKELGFVRNVIHNRAVEASPEHQLWYRRLIELWGAEQKHLFLLMKLPR
jgi:hypothetical protein